MGTRTKFHAQRLADELAARLKAAFGVEWKTKIWDNRGWCYSVSYGNLTVTKPGAFYASIGHASRDLPLWHDSFCSDDPVKAVLQRLEKANEMLQRLHKLVWESVPISVDLSVMRDKQEIKRWNEVSDGCPYRQDDGTCGDERNMTPECHLWACPMTFRELARVARSETFGKR